MADQNNPYLEAQQGLLGASLPTASAAAPVTQIQPTNEDLYLQQKLSQLANDQQAQQAAQAAGWKGSTTQELKDYMQSVGVTPYQHYQKYGKQEGLDWNKQSVEDIYLEQKLSQLARDPEAQARARQMGWTGETPEELKTYMQSLGLTPFEHYQKYGLQEGLQSSGFDTFGGLEDAYLQQKLDQLARDQQAQQAAQQIGWTGSTAGELKDFMQSVGLTPYQHYQKYGKQEGLSWAQPNFEEQPQQAKLEGILSGFEALGKGEFTEDQVKNFIGQDKFKEYKDQFGGALKSGIANILADNNLSGQEVMSAVQTARKYGLDNDEISNLTGYDKKLFDAINEGYDSTVNSLVDKALEGKEGLGDKVKTNLALQLQYGLTDEDLAKASDVTAEQVKGLLDPVRNFGAQYKDVISKPDAASKDILSFIDTAKNNQAIDSIYGDKLDALKQQVELANEKWKGSGLDGYQAENVYQGINSRTNENYLRGAAFGGAEGKAKELTKFFVNSGITNINDLGVRPVPIDPENPEGALRPEFYNKKTGKPLKSSGNIVYAADIAAGYDPKISSGQWKGIAPGQNLAFGQTWEGKGSTTFNVAFDKNLNPIFNSYGNSTSSLPELAPLLTIGTALLAPAVSGYLSSALAGAGGSSLAAGTLANTALTQGILSGGMAALTGGDVLKSALLGAAGAPISAGISSLLPTGMDPNLARMATNIGTTAATSALAGKPMNLQGALINAGVQYGAQQLPWNLTPQQVNLLAGVATPYLQGQSISPTQLSGILANYAIKSQMPQKGVR